MAVPSSVIIGNRTDKSPGISGARAPKHSLLPGSSRYESLTLWRGVACLSVAVYHSLFTGYGLNLPDGAGAFGGVLEVLRRAWIGVPLFFVISGYCVTASADASRGQPRPGPAFFWRRFRRIFPPYWLWLFVVASAVIVVEFYVAPGFFGTAFVPNPARFALSQWLGNLTLSESWRWNITGGVESALLSPSWTLCYEEQFYALVGLCLIFCRRYFFQALACISVAVLIGMVLLPSAGVPTWGLFLDGKWLMFAAGVLAYYALNYVPSAKVPLYCIPIGLGVLAAVANPGNLLKPLVNEPNQSYLAAFVFSLVIIALRKWDERLLQSRLARPLRFCGERCYSIYLVHWPTVTVVSWAFNQLGVRKPFLVFFIGLPICVGAAVGLGWLFHRWVERRFLSSRRRAPAHPAVTAP